MGRNVAGLFPSWGGGSLCGLSLAVRGGVDGGGVVIPSWLVMD